MPTRPILRLGALFLTGVLFATACNSSSDDSSASRALDPRVGDLPDDALEIMTGPAYDGARWSVLVTEVESGDEVLALNSDALRFMGSNMKLLTIGTALDVLGPDRTMTTPVHRVGDDLVLVGSGDLVLGGREAGSGELGYSVPPQPDANGIPGAMPAPGDPLAGLDDLARQVAASGVTTVPGDVLVDDRLFEPFAAPASISGPASPIVVNDNLLAVLTSPGNAPGDPATIRTVPDTAAFELVNEVVTVEEGSDEGTGIDFEEGVGNQLVVVGTVEAGSDEVLNVFDVPDPASFARTLFIEALQRAGVSVASDPVTMNDASALPPAEEYSDDNRVAAIESPPYREQAQLIMKISHNLGANLALCLLAVEAGSTDCTDGFGAIRERMANAGIADGSAWLVDGAGSDPSEITADAIVAWLVWMDDEVGADTLENILPIMGVDGSIGGIGVDSPAQGKIEAKTGTSASLDLSDGRLLMKGKALAGYMESDDGTLYAFGLYMNNGSYEDLGSGQRQANNDLGNVAIAIQRSL